MEIIEMKNSLAGLASDFIQQKKGSESEGNTGLLSIFPLHQFLL